MFGFASSRAVDTVPNSSSFLGRIGRAGRERRGQQETDRREEKKKGQTTQCNAMHKTLQEHATVGRIPTLSQIGAAHQFTVALAGFGVASASHACRRER